MKKALATVALAAGIAGLTGCGVQHGGYTTVANQNYCVNQATGEVMPPQYCQVGGSYYNPMLYDYWIGPVYGHHYGVGTVIQHNYFVKGRQVKPNDTAARKAAGLPVSGSVSNGAKSTTTTRTSGSTPAKPQNSPSRTGVSGSTSKPSTSTSRSTTTSRPSTSFGSSGSSSRTSSSFGSSGSSSRSSSSFGSSGGRR